MSKPKSKPTDPTLPISLENIPHTLPLPGGIPPNHRPHTESTTTILVPTENIAFLNPVQQYNRDLSVAVIRAWNELRKEEAEAVFIRKRENGLRMKGERERKKREKAAKRAEEGGVVPQSTTLSAEVVPQSTEPEAGPSTEKPFRPSRITILEALSATGLRSIRYAKEIPDVKVVLANDLSPSACAAMRTNVALNGVAEAPRPSRPIGKPAEGPIDEEPKLPAEELSTEEAGLNGETTPEDLSQKVGRRPGANGGVRINEGDACALMYNHRTPQMQVDVVDLDPYGTAAPFIDAAIGCIKDGGLLCITCTDLAVLAGSQYPEKSYSNYGGICVSAEYSHEVALRLVLNGLAQSAARYGRYITPLLSLSIDFYVRLFIRVNTGAEKVKKLASQTGIVYVCSYCQTSTTQRLGRIVEKEGKGGNVNRFYKSAAGVNTSTGTCEECGSTAHLGGPMWMDPIHDATFVERVMKSIEGQEKDYGTFTRMQGMLNIAKDELPDPFYFTLNKVLGLAHSSSAPTTKAVSALLNAGYKVSRSHASAGSIKTNAPRSFIYDLVRDFIKENPVRMDKIPEGSPVRRLIAKEMVHTIDFTPHGDAKLYDRGEKGANYPSNPLPNWGPGSRAKSVKAKPAERTGTLKQDNKRKSEEVNISWDVAASEEEVLAKKMKVDDETMKNGSTRVEIPEEEEAMNA